MTSEEKVRADITARGEVQGVGYRDIVKKAARKMKLTGFVENAPSDEIRIVCEGDKESIESFIELIKINEPPIDVEDLKVDFTEATGKFGHFRIKRGDMAEELGERIDLLRAEIKHTNTQNQILEKEISEIKERLKRVESADA